MNSLSWFLYLTGVIDNAREAAIAAMVIGGLFTAMWCGGHYFLGELPKPAKWPFVCLTFAALLLIFTPNKNTMYAIAASELGETIVKTEAVQGMASDAQRALQQWIKRQIEPEKKS